jgi:hypothetical protein
LIHLSTRKSCFGMANIVTSKNLSALIGQRHGVDNFIGRIEDVGQDGNQPNGANEPKSN